MSSVFSSPFMEKKPFSSNNKIRVSSKYKKGDYVSEDDLDKALRLPNSKGKTGVSGQDFSAVKYDTRGPYVVRINDKLK